MSEKIMSETEWRTEFSQMLQLTMLNQRLTQQKLSILSGVSQSSISRYINGKSTPSIFDLHRIAKAIGCSVDAITP